MRSSGTVADESDRLGSSGVFKAIVESARKLTRAVTGAEEPLSPGAEELGRTVARAFIAGRFGDVHARMSMAAQGRFERATFERRWAEAVQSRAPLTKFEVTNAGEIDVHFIPGLEETPQSEFVAFLEIRFASPEVPLDHDRAFVVGLVILDQGDGPRIGALHTR